MHFGSELNDVFGRPPFHMVAKVENGNVLVGMRQIMNLFEPNTANTRRAHFNNMLTCQPAQKTDELEATLVKVDRHMNHYEA